MFMHRDFGPHRHAGHFHHVQPAPLRGSLLPLALAFGAMAIGASALGALAVGRLAVGKASIGRARIKALEIDELIVHKMRRPEEPPRHPSGNGEG